jgi:hypothetical protein
MEIILYYYYHESVYMVLSVYININKILCKKFFASGLTQQAHCKTSTYGFK